MPVDQVFIHGQDGETEKDICKVCNRTENENMKLWMETKNEFDM